MRHSLRKSKAYLKDVRIISVIYVSQLKGEKMTNCVIIDVEKPIRCRECGEIIRWERSRTNRTVVCGYVMSIRSLIDCGEEVENGSESKILSDNDVQKLTRLLGDKSIPKHSGEERLSLSFSEYKYHSVLKTRAFWALLRAISVFIAYVLATVCSMISIGRTLHDEATVLMLKSLLTLPNLSLAFIIALVLGSLTLIPKRKKQRLDLSLVTDHMDECQHCGNKQCEMLKSFKAFKDNKAELSGEDLDFFCDWFMKYNKYDDAENVSHIVEKIRSIQYFAELGNTPILVEIGNEICTEKRRRNILIYDKV